MISWRLFVPALPVAAATAGCLTYFFTPSPPVEAAQPLPLTSPAMKGFDGVTQTNIDQHLNAEEKAKAAFEAILRRAPDLQASASEPASAAHVPLPKSRPLQRP